MRDLLKCCENCVGSILEKKHVHVQRVAGRVTSRIAWGYGKLYKPGKILPEVERSRKAVRFH